MKKPDKKLARALMLGLRSKKSQRIVLGGIQNTGQLLRALIPLYLTRSAKEVSITGGDIEAFWKERQVVLQSPNAGKQFREHIGYARRTKEGLRITPNGIRYVEAVLRAS